MLTYREGMLDKYCPPVVPRRIFCQLKVLLLKMIISRYLGPIPMHFRHFICKIQKNSDSDYFFSDYMQKLTTFSSPLILPTSGRKHVPSINATSLFEIQEPNTPLCKGYLPLDIWPRFPFYCPLYC